LFYREARLVLLLITLLYGLSTVGFAHTTAVDKCFDKFQVPDSTFESKDSLLKMITPDSTRIDSLADSTKVKKNKPKSEIEDPVEYTAQDSMAITMGETKKVYLWGDANVKYQDIELTAAYIEFDMDQQLVFAHGAKDSANRDVGLPIFKQGSQTLNAHQLSYNFKTKKGFIEAIKTEQDGGYLHAEQTKRLPNGDINLKGGKYTTCDADHPHFYIALTKAISIPGDKIISGPAYVVLEDVPLKFLALPFGFFPNTKKSSTGILIPTYGEEQTRGFYLRGAGYYIPINDYVDMRITGDLYSKGTWGISANTNYKKRYAFAGSFNGRFYENITSEKDLPDYAKSKDFSIQWSHRQDPKANPTQTFTASVDFSSSSYDQNHSYNINSVLNNRKSSSISYTKLWPNSPFNLSAGLTHKQNSSDQSVDMSLPSVNLSMGTIYPFRSLGKVGKDHFWQNIQLSYNSALQNNVYTTDTALFTSHMFDRISNGYKQNIPLSMNIKPFSGFNISPSLNYSAVMYTSHIKKYWDPLRDINPNDTLLGAIVTDTIQGINYAHSIYPSISFTLNPKIYGSYQFKKGRLKAIRHVITPSASLSFVPDMKGLMPNYYDSVYDGNTGKGYSYSRYEGYLFGTPSFNGRSGSVNLSLRNTLEMKLKDKSDTSDAVKKVKLLDNFDFATSYNIFAETFKWSTIRFNTGTSLFNNLFDVRLNANIDPYQLDGAGKRIDRLELSDFVSSHRLGRITNAQMSVGTRFKSAARDPKKDTKGKTNQTGGMDQEDEIPGQQGSNDEFESNSHEDVDFNIPWSLNVDYSWSYSKPTTKKTIIQSLRLSGDFSLTPKWKIGCNTGYDFVSGKMTMTNININRDLHCWVMELSLVPFGSRKSYSFQINVKSSILKDLKYNKRKSWYDNF
jgi:hypothetical protein